MIAALPTWQRRTLAVTVLITAAVLTCSVVVWPVFGVLANHRAWRATALETLARYRALTEKRDPFEAALLQVRGDSLWQSLYVAESAALASAQLQTDVRGFLDPQKVVLDSLQPVDALTELQVTRVGVRIVFRTTIDQLTLFLSRIESAPKLLRIDDAVITSAPSQASDVNPELSIRMEVWGYVIPKGRAS